MRENELEKVLKEHGQEHIWEAYQKLDEAGKEKLASQIENNNIDLLIFFRDPLTPSSHEPDVNDIVKRCDIYNIPVATNIATAEALILALDRGDLDWREMYK